ncbi:MAG TPA: enoyl-CoA hydratase/isomerase family protein [Burkholderiales bacterium]|nr:enoyl-CoA hydratase/isomerase family protein [Burkholderiales bacterium]
MTDRYARYTALKFDRPHPRVIRVTFNSGLKMGAMTPAMHREVSEVWKDLEADDSVNAVIITGEGKSFSAGGDLNHEIKLTEDYNMRMQAMREARNLVYGIINCPKPIVSGIRGWAVGAGIACALLADVSVAAKDAKFMDGHTKIGVAAGDHALIAWPLLVGMAKAKYYLLCCERLDGAEAERLGLVSLAVDDEQVEAKTIEIASKLADGAQGALRWTKHCLNNWLRVAGPSFDASLAMEFIGFGGPEGKEGMQAFLEKREAKFPPETPAGL